MTYDWQTGCSGTSASCLDLHSEQDAMSLRFVRFANLGVSSNESNERHIKLWQLKPTAALNAGNVSALFSALDQSGRPLGAKGKTDVPSMM